MGWSSGSELMSTVISVIQPHIPDADVRKNVYKPLIAAFEDMDCDTMGECQDEDPAFDAALREVHPHWDWDD